MISSGYEIIWLFFVYSFLGWLFETIVAAVRQKIFTNRGLVNAPLCVIYGISAVMVSVFFKDLNGIWLFVGSMILTTVIEWTAGHLIEKLYHERWWDYSGIKGNLDGYVCIPVSVLWGVLCFVMMEVGNPGLIQVFRWIPSILGKILIWILSGVLALDVIATLCVLSGRSRKIQQWRDVDSWLTQISSGLGRWIYGGVDRRIRRAYPATKRQDYDALEEERKAKKNVFAYGCCFYKIVWLFVIGAFLGDVVETLFCRVTAGVWMSRSSVVWGAFQFCMGNCNSGCNSFSL